MTERSDIDRDEDPELAGLLRHCRVPAPPPGLFERSVAQALCERERRTALARSRVRWLATGFGAAAAAATVLLMVAGPLPFSRSPEPMPSVSMQLYEPETLRLVFASETTLEHATMTVTLPEGVELEGFPGEHEIRWDTSLVEGRNLLPLTLIATEPAGGVLRARLEHAARDRTFELRIDVG